MRSFSVTEVNQYIKRILAADPILRQMIVEGEISNLTKHRSGHYYFTLKDDQSKMSCVMFANQVATLTFSPENGDKIAVKGQISVYERDGRYQLYVYDMEKKGLGALHVAFEKLKKELAAEGYFDAKYKKTLPAYPARIGVVTSPTGAAIRDIIAVYNRRSPLSELIIYPVRVQGAFSKDELCDAIEYFNKRDDIALIILARGGGSIEELWSFNERAVAEAIFRSKIPVVTGIGHEIDFTIADFVADLRTATPSAAAEVVIKSKVEIKMALNRLMMQMAHAAEMQLETNSMRLKNLSPVSMARRYRLQIEHQREMLMGIRQQMASQMQWTVKHDFERLDHIGQKLHALSPFQTLNRGYAVVTTAQHAVQSIADVNVGDSIVVKIHDGNISATVDHLESVTEDLTVAQNGPAALPPKD
ncbi:exodeoxyribonuclease VII large subunit [Fusibacter paucivorans]|nr:exodeoxyribonuclease VII large subunit [Fusibacter paucivorans]